MKESIVATVGCELYFHKGKACCKILLHRFQIIQYELVSPFHCQPRWTEELCHVPPDTATIYRTLDHTTSPKAWFTSDLIKNNKPITHEVVKKL